MIAPALAVGLGSINFLVEFANEGDKSYCLLPMASVLISYTTNEFSSVDKVRI
jgi:hypothetical protein